MFNWKNLFSFGKSPTLQVDFTQRPIIPKGAVEISYHTPVTKNDRVTLTPENFLLKQMPAYESYSDYMNKHAKDCFCNSLVLDAFVNKLKENNSSWTRSVKQLFGIKRGQIFFLGTTFHGEIGIECVPFLSINTDAPGLRNLCPADQLIRPDFEIYSCIIQGV